MRSWVKWFIGVIVSILVLFGVGFSLLAINHYLNNKNNTALTNHTEDYGYSTYTPGAHILATIEKDTNNNSYVSKSPNFQKLYEYTPKNQTGQNTTTDKNYILRILLTYSFSYCRICFKIPSFYVSGANVYYSSLPRNEINNIPNLGNQNITVIYELSDSYTNLLPPTLGK